MPRAHADLQSALSRIRTLVATLSRAARGVEETTGVSNAQLFLLGQLVRSGALSINELAERALTTQSTVSTLVTRLEHARLVRRARSERDGRRVLVHLTPRGRRLCATAPEPPTARLIGALRELSRTEQRGLTRALDALLERLGASPAVSPPLFEPLPATRRRRRATRAGAARSPA